MTTHGSRAAESRWGNVLGYEPAGRTLEVGADIEKFVQCQDVLLPFNIVCGKCRNCRDGNSHMCESIRHYGFDETAQPGGFSVHAVVPKADFNLIEMPNHAEHRGMAGLGCRFVTSYHAMADRADIRAGD